MGKGASEREKGKERRRNPALRVEPVQRRMYIRASNKTIGPLTKREGLRHGRVISNQEYRQRERGTQLAVCTVAN